MVMVIRRASRYAVTVARCSLGELIAVAQTVETTLMLT